MWTRTKSTSEGGITATFTWDPGDPAAGIPPGWGEETGAEIRYALDPGNFGGKLITHISFRDVETIMDFSAQTGQRGYEHKRLDDPADWIVDHVQVEYRPYGDDAPSITLAERPGGRERILRLSQLPEVLEVVVDAYTDMQAAERLSMAQEGVQMLEAEIDSLQWFMGKQPWRDPDRLAKLLRELELAKVELAQAERHAQERGVT